MARKFKKLIKNENGQAIIELAIAMPLLILILGGILDFGWIYANQNIINHCAREGARYAIVHATDTNAITNITNFTKSISSSHLAKILKVNIKFSNVSSPRSGNVSITVSGDVNVLTPILGVFTDNQTVTLSSSCTMKVE